jgi:hypothetical protein
MGFVEPGKLRAPIGKIFGPIFYSKFQWSEKLPDRFDRSLLHKFVDSLGEVDGANHGLFQHLRDILVAGLTA